MRGRLYCVASAAAMTAVLGAGAAHAQGAEENDPTNAQGTAPDNPTRPRQAAGVQSSGTQAHAAEEEIIITATAGGQQQKARKAPFEITTLSADELRHSGQISSEALINQIPGVFSESSAGNSTGSNIFVRGYAGASGARFVTVQYLGTPLYPSSNVIFDQSTQHIRLLDPMVERVEGVIAGTGQLYGSGQIGMTINVIPVIGGDIFTGLVGAGVTSYGEVRGEAMVSGPLAKGVTFAVGGFYHHGDSVRRSGFATERGGQISGNVKVDLGPGSLLLWGRHMNDTGAFVTDFPVNLNGNKVQEWPGFPLGTYSPYSNADRHLVLPNGNKVDLGQGRKTVVDSFGYQLEYDPAVGVHLFSRSALFRGNIPSAQLFPFLPPTTVDAFAAAQGLSNYMARVNGAAVPGTTPVLLDTLWFTTGKLRSFSTESGITLNLGANNKLTIGGYWADYRANQAFNIFNQILLTAETQPSLVSLSGQLGGVDTVCTDNYGFRSQASGTFNLYRATRDHGDDLAGYVSDDWQVTDALRIDAGLRWQRSSVTSDDTLFQVANEFNNITPPFLRFRYRDSKPSFTTGATYTLSKSANLWARYSVGHYFPTFADVFNYVRADNNFRIVTAKVRSIEGGVKYGRGGNALSLTMFDTLADNLNAVQVQLNGVSSSIGSSRSFGGDVDGQVEPLAGFYLGTKISYVDAKYRSGVFGGASLAGKKVEQQPKWHVRGYASYLAKLSPDFTALLNINGEWVGARYANPLNTVRFPSYFTMNAAITFTYADRYEFRISSNNLNDSHGIGECIACSVQGFGRPLLGRSFSFDARVKF